MGPYFIEKMGGRRTLEMVELIFGQGGVFESQGQKVADQSGHSEQLL